MKNLDGELKTEVEGIAQQLSEADIAKIEKKKAKKLASKLKKQQKKASDQKSEGDTKSNIVVPNNKEKKLNKKNSKQNGKRPIDLMEINELENNAPNEKSEKKRLKTEKKKKKLQQLKEERESRPKVHGEEAATIFVGNLPINTKRVQLRRLFKDYGPVNSIRLRTAGGRLIYKHKHRLEAGTLSAYIVLNDADSANRALTLNGIEFKSQHLRITRADKNSHNSGDVDTKRTIFVGNLKYSATEEKLREIFSNCGEIDYVRCLRDGEKGCNGVAYVCFKAPEAIGLALELKDTILDERPIHVERYSVKKLGAKKLRDEEEQKSKKPLTGAKKRLDVKNKIQIKTQLSKKVDSNDMKKKGEFRGVKVNNIKKKQKKKKPPSHLQQLAKKIAPKTA